MAWRPWPPRKLDEVSERLAELARRKLDADPTQKSVIIRRIDELLDQHLELCDKHRETP